MTDEYVKQGPRKPGPKPGFQRAPRSEEPYAEARHTAFAAADDRDRHDRLEIDQEYLKMLTDSEEYSTLPILPKLEGFHCVWSSTTNEQTGIRFHLSRRYTPIRIEEMPDFYKKIKQAGHEVGGEFDGCVRFKEMVAMKIPLNLYYTGMMYHHNQLPREQEEVIKENIEGRLQYGDKSVVRDMSEGFKELGQRASRPSFE